MATASEFLDLAPQGKIDFEVVPEPVLRHLFEAFRLEIVYDQVTDKTECRVTLVSETIPAQYQAAREVLEAGAIRVRTPQKRKDRDHLIPIMQPFGQYPNRVAAKWLHVR